MVQEFGARLQLFILVELTGYFCLLYSLAKSNQCVESSAFNITATNKISAEETYLW